MISVTNCYTAEKSQGIFRGKKQLKNNGHPVSYLMPDAGHSNEATL